MKSARTVLYRKIGLKGLGLGRVFDAPGLPVLSSRLFAFAIPGGYLLSDLFSSYSSYSNYLSAVSWPVMTFFGSYTVP